MVQYHDFLCKTNELQRKFWRYFLVLSGKKEKKNREKHGNLSGGWFQLQGLSVTAQHTYLSNMPCLSVPALDELVQRLGSTFHTGSRCQEGSRLCSSPQSTAPHTSSSLHNGLAVKAEGERIEKETEEGILSIVYGAHASTFHYREPIVAAYQNLHGSAAKLR